MIQQIKELRVKIDGLYQLTKELKPIRVSTPNTISEVTYFNSKEIEESAKSLLLAKAWLGKLLGELGSSNPYSSSKKTVEDIEPTADTSDRDVKAIYDGSWNNESHIEKVDWIRSEIQSVIDKINSPEILHNIDNGLTWNNTYTHLCEAKMWLGFEFARIRDNEK